MTTKEVATLHKVKIKQGTFKHIESELYSYHETKKEIEWLKKDILLSGHISDLTKEGRTNIPGDPTGETAILMNTHRKIEQLERIVEAIEEIYGQLSEEKKKMIKLRYWTKPRTLTWEGIAKEIPAHRATVIRWRNEIIKAIADKLGWR